VAIPTLFVLKDESNVGRVLVHHYVIDGLDVGTDDHVAALVDDAKVARQVAQLVPTGPRHVQNNADALVKLGAHCKDNMLDILVPYTLHDSWGVRSASSVGSYDHNHNFSGVKSPALGKRMIDLV
jgi:hypothetical protein